MHSKSAFVLGLLSLSIAARAADVGPAAFPADLGGRNAWEISYQSLERDLDNGATLEADTYLLRMHTELGPAAFLDIDLGAIDAGEAAFYGGLGLRYLAYDSERVRVSPFGQLHYGAGIESDEGGEFDLLQGDVGVLVAGRLHLADGLELQPYAGPLLSILRVDGDEAGDADEDHPFGGVAGLALVMPDHNSIRIEAQFFDEVSLSAAFSIVFQ